MIWALWLSLLRYIKLWTYYKNVRIEIKSYQTKQCPVFLHNLHTLIVQKLFKLMLLSYQFVQIVATCGTIWLHKQWHYQINSNHLFPILVLILNFSRLSWLRLHRGMFRGGGAWSGIPPPFSNLAMVNTIGCKLGINN